MSKTESIFNDQDPNTRPRFTVQNYKAILSAICQELNFHLVHYKKIDTTLSGSTGVICLIDRDRVVTANVGDSKAVLITRSLKVLKAKNEKGGEMNGGGRRQRRRIKRGNRGAAPGRKPAHEYGVRELTRDHNPSLAQEKARILEAGGVIRPSMCNLTSK